MKKFFNFCGGAAVSVILFLCSFFPVRVFGAEPPFKSMQDIVNFLNSILKYIGIIFWIFAVGSLLYAGFIYMKGANDPENIKKAKKQLTYSIIAIVIGIMAYGAPKLVESILGAN